MSLARLGVVFALAGCACVLAAPAASAADLPAPTGYVVDAAAAVPDAEQRLLEAELAAYAERSGHQVAEAVVTTTGGKSIEDYANDLFAHWGVGDKERDDGVLIVVATQDRQLRIEVGRGLEGTLTDIEAADIVRDRMAPRLREGHLTDALRDGERQVRAALGDPTPEAGGEGAAPLSFRGYGGGAASSRTGSGFGLFPLVVLGFVALSLFSRLGSRRRRRPRGGLFVPLFLGSGWGGGSGFGGGSSGGGFGGFGGGSSGGGGASGSW